MKALTFSYFTINFSLANFKISIGPLFDNIKKKIWNIALSY